MPKSAGVWAAPEEAKASAGAAPTAFQLRFQNKALIVGSEGDNIQLTAAASRSVPPKPSKGPLPERPGDPNKASPTSLQRAAPIHSSVDSGSRVSRVVQRRGFLTPQAFQARQRRLSSSLTPAEPEVGHLPSPPQWGMPVGGGPAPAQSTLLEKPPLPHQMGQSFTALPPPSLARAVPLHSFPTLSPSSSSSGAPARRVSFACHNHQAGPLPSDSDNSSVTIEVYEEMPTPSLQRDQSCGDGTVGAQRGTAIAQPCVESSSSSRSSSAPPPLATRAKTKGAAGPSQFSAANTTTTTATSKRALPPLLGQQQAASTRPPSPTSSIESLADPSQELETSAAGGDMKRPARTLGAPVAGFKPYSMASYQQLKEALREAKVGSLGPADTDAQRIARERRERQRAYGKAAERKALEALAAAAASSHGKSEKESNDGAEEDSERSRSGQRVHARFAPPTPREVVEARARRERAMQYADQIAPPKEVRETKSKAQPRLKDDRSPQLTQLEQRLLDLETKHQHYQASVEQVIRQLGRKEVVSERSS